MRPYLEPIDTLRQKDAPTINNDSKAGRAFNVLNHICFFSGCIAIALYAHVSKNKDSAPDSGDHHHHSDTTAALVYTPELSAPKISLEADTPPRDIIVSEDY